MQCFTMYFYAPRAVLDFILFLVGAIFYINIFLIYV